MHLDYCGWAVLAWFVLWLVTVYNQVNRLKSATQVNPVWLSWSHPERWCFVWGECWGNRNPELLCLPILLRNDSTLFHICVSRPYCRTLLVKLRCHVVVDTVSKVEFWLQGSWIAKSSTDSWSDNWPWRWYSACRYGAAAKYIFHKWCIAISRICSLHYCRLWWLVRFLLFLGRIVCIA